MNQTIRDFIEVSKPRIVFMVLVTSAIGYLMGGRGVVDGPVFVLSLLGTGAAAAGAAVLNNYLEREFDARMIRTRHRAIPSGRMDPGTALTFGILLILFGVSLLVWQVNTLTGFLVLLTAFLYVLVYTPLKRWTWLNTSIGAIPGALPPVSGWCAATEQVELGAWILFAILFVWQHPHFYAIAWMYRDDYREAGFKMLPSIDPSGRRLFRHIIGYSILLIGVAAIPAFIGMAGSLYLIGSLVIGLALLEVGIHLSRTAENHDARRVLKMSVYYLPILLLLVSVDILL